MTKTRVAARPLLLVRHARAVDEHPAGDFARGLDGEGRASFREHARLLAGEVSLEGIATSPLVRAVQTAEILAEAVRLDEVLVLPELAPESAGAERIAQVARRLGRGWALVGHNPSFEETAALLGGWERLPFRFRKGAAVAFELTAGATTPLWRWNPGKRRKPAALE